MRRGFYRVVVKAKQLWQEAGALEFTPSLKWWARKNSPASRSTWTPFPRHLGTLSALLWPADSITVEAHSRNCTQPPRTALAKDYHLPWSSPHQTTGSTGVGRFRFLASTGRNQWAILASYLLKSTEDFVDNGSQLNFCSPQSCFSLLHVLCCFSVNLTSHKSPSQKDDLRFDARIDKDHSKLNFCWLINLPIRCQWGALYWWFLNL